MDKKILIQNILIILVILTVVFLSQQPYFRPLGKSVYSQGVSQGSAYWSKMSGWFKAAIYPKVSSQVASGGAKAQQEIVTQKKNFAQSMLNAVKNYFTTKFSKISGSQLK